MGVKLSYKQTEVGIIPEDWNVVLFRDVTHLITCGLAATPTYVSESVGKPFLSAQNVRSGRVVFDNHKFISHELFEKITRHNKPRRGDLLYTRVGAGIGEAGIIECDIEFGIYVSLTLIKTDSQKLHNGFATHLLNSPCYRALAKGGQFAGAGVQNLNVEVVRNFPLPLPSLPEQRSIATALSDMDELLGALDRLIAKKRDLKQAAMQQLLTGKTRLLGFGEGTGYQKTEVGEIPEDWDVKPLKEISPQQSVGLVINPSTYFDKEGTVPMLVGSNISENKIDWASAKKITEDSNQKLPASRLSAGDLVMVRVGDPGTTAVIPPEFDGCNCASMMIVRKHPSFDSEWLCFVMNSLLGRSQVAGVQYGTAQKQFNISDAVDFRYPVPSLSEQRSIATVLSDMDAEITALEQRRDKTRALKQAMMQELLTGRIRLV